jgi:hypothetical protein
MSATLHVLHQNRAIAGFLRVGHTGQRWLEDRHACGRLPFRRFVFDAAHIAEQAQLLRELKRSGCEVVLDPNVAELSAVGKFSGAVAKLPWAHGERPWRPDDFGSRRNRSLAHEIAEFAVAHGVDAVLSASHLDEADHSWRHHDLDMVHALRRSLDEMGGRSISIDYQLITTSAALKDPLYRTEAVNSMSDLPVENWWLRVSGFDARSTGTGTRRFIEAIRDFHAAGHPLISDMVGGFPALAASAAGGISGFAGGIAQKEAFRAAEYLRIPTGSGGGSGPRIYLPELDRFVSEEQLNAIVSARGAKSRVMCADTDCCPSGREDMVDNYKGHFLYQRHRQIDELSRTPDTRKFGHFLLNQLGPAVRGARTLARLKIPDPDVLNMIDREKKRLILMNDALGALYESSQETSRSEAARFRGGGAGLSVLSRRS